MDASSSSAKESNQRNGKLNPDYFHILEEYASRVNAEADHSFGYDLAMGVGQVMLRRLQATRTKLVQFYDAIKEV